jgi:hypothetical protein
MLRRGRGPCPPSIIAGLGIGGVALALAARKTDEKRIDERLAVTSRRLPDRGPRRSFVTRARDAAALVGTVLNRRYRIDSVIGPGENGAWVFRAHDIVMGTPVAVRCPGIPDGPRGIDYEPHAKGMLRGGSWDYSATSAKATFRYPFQANVGNISTGFRCARDTHD